MSTMTARPPLNRTFYGTTTGETEKDSEQRCGTIGAMRPVSVVTGSDADTGDVVVNNRPDQSLGLKLSSESSIETNERSTAQKGNVDPIEMLVPIA
jgi:hypothetical protein